MIQTNNALPGGLKVAAIYFVVIGVFGILWPFLGFGPSHSQFRAKSRGYKLGAYSREILIGIAFLVAGTAIFARQSWAPRLAYVILAVATFYSANDVAWGFSGGPPNRVVRTSFFLVVGAWNAFWAFMVHRGGVP